MSNKKVRSNKKDKVKTIESTGGHSPLY